MRQRSTNQNTHEAVWRGERDRVVENRVAYSVGLPNQVRSDRAAEHRLRISVRLSNRVKDNRNSRCEYAEAKSCELRCLRRASGTLQRPITNPPLSVHLSILHYDPSGSRKQGPRHRHPKRSRNKLGWSNQSPMNPLQSQPRYRSAASGLPALKSRNFAATAVQATA